MALPHIHSHITLSIPLHWSSLCYVYPSCVKSLMRILLPSRLSSVLRRASQHLLKYNPSNLLKLFILNSLIRGVGWPFFKNINKLILVEGFADYYINSHIPLSITLHGPSLWYVPIIVDLSSLWCIIYIHSENSLPWIILSLWLLSSPRRVRKHFSKYNHSSFLLECSIDPL